MGSPENSVPHQDPPHEAQAPGLVAHPAPPSEPLPKESLWARIRRHKVVEWTLAYAAFGYATLHLVEMLRDAFEWPALVPRLTVFGLVLGTPVAVTLAWYHGHRAQHRVSGRELSILIASLLVAGSVLWLVSRHERAAVPRVAVRSTSAAGTVAPEATFSPPPHSIAVLPFVNISGDKEQEYFSDGLTEELLNSLARINELQVAARTSSFSFQGEHPDIATVAHKLNVASVLEGSVRRSAHTVRIRAQLVNGVTGFHLWSQTYDRNLGDVLDLQTEIATEVATALKVTLLGDVSAKIELGGTRNPAAFDAYLRGSKAHRLVHADIKDAQTAISAYSEAVSLDPNYALAFAARSLARSGCALQFVPEPGARDFYDKALADARRSIDLAPDLAEGYWALGLAFAYGFFDFAQASGNYERAVALAPGNAEVLGASGVLAVHMGRFDAGIGAVRRAATLDPLSPLAHYQLGTALFWAHRYQEAVPSFDAFIVLDPDSSYVYAFRGLAYYKLGDYEKARLSCEAKGGEYPQLCLAVTYDRLGRHADAEAELAKMKAAKGDSFAYQYAETYAQWGKFPEALEWLEEAMRLRDSGLVWLKTDPLVDPLRQEPRFQAIERELKFPQ